jgi:hypothetical protein
VANAAALSIGDAPREATHSLGCLMRQQSAMTDIARSTSKPPRLLVRKRISVRATVSARQLEEVSFPPDPIYARSRDRSDVRRNYFRERGCYPPDVPAGINQLGVESVGHHYRQRKNKDHRRPSRAAHRNVCRSLCKAIVDLHLVTYMTHGHAAASGTVKGRPRDRCNAQRG